MEKLPGEVLTDILIRLPAKPLAQMRCVSKPWNALLSKPSFVKSHLSRSIHNNDEILLVFHDYRRVNKELFTAHPAKSPHLKLSNFIKLPVNLAEITGATVIGSVNGLVCFYERAVVDFLIYIWNPSLGAFVTLPPTPMPFDSDYRFCFGFGFDPKTDDYKVVKLLGEVNFALTHVIEEWLQVEVYSMRKGSWESVDSFFPSLVTRILNNDVVCVNGCDGYFHWLCDVGDYSNEPRTQVIRKFDFDAYSFTEMSLPDSIVYARNVLGFLAGKLCVISRKADSNFEVWVMEEYGVAESWVKRQVFSEGFGYKQPYGFTLKNGFVFEALDDCLALCDPNVGMVKSFNIKARKYDVIVPYVESLVWVRPDKVASKHIR